MAKKDIIKRAVSSPLVQAFLIYISGGWIALEITDYIITNYSLNERARDVLSIILLIGLPIVIFLAWYLSRERKAGEEAVKKDKDVKSLDSAENQIQTRAYSIKRSRILISGTLIILALTITLFFRLRHQSKILWAKGEAISEIYRLMDEDKWIDAFKMAGNAEKYIATDSVLIELWPRISRYVTIHSEPVGAKVYRRAYDSNEEDWEYLGETPIDSIRFPYEWYRMKVSKEGFQTAVTGRFSSSMLFKLISETDSTQNMVYVPGGEYEIYIPGLEHLGPVNLEEYLIDIYEVTNRQYKEFIDNGGYKKPQYWMHEFIKDGQTLTWDEAMSEFRDATGKPGPSTWELGDYLNGLEDYPVSGISWYEAAAYAEFAGKSLPTLYHWSIAANTIWGSVIIPQSNYNGQGPSPVGTNSAMSPRYLMRFSHCI